MLIRLGLLALSSLLLTFAYAPYSQFYLAWIGMVPWLLALRGTRNGWSAYGWGFIGGCIFNLISLTWLFHATTLGTMVLIGYMSLFWGLAAAILHGTRVFDASARWQPAIATLLIALIWTGCEWFRGWLFNGFQWMFLGQTQSPLVVMCQVADVGGVFAVSFWVMCVNALLFLAACGVADRKAILSSNVSASATPQAAASWGALVPTTIVTVSIFAITISYGWFRIAQTSTTPGPRVMVVQPNFPHERGGARTVSWEDQTTYHLAESWKALSNKSQPVDLVVWSETVLPPMNAEARSRTNEPRLRTGIHDDLLALVQKHSTSLVFGAYALLSFDGSEANADIRNSTYLYSAFLDHQPRYDKIHLVPYGESVPFRRSFPRLHRLMFQMAAYSVNYLITAGAFDDLRVFDLPTRDSTSKWRFVTPICFEDIDGRLVSAMFRPTKDQPGVKRADVIINISNDGWFKGNMRRQHFQNAIFRSIENRVPTARADNTGISGYIDSVGRVDWDSLMTEGRSGIRTKQVQIDPRLTFYTRFGDVFGAGCFITSCAIWIVLRVFNPWIRRRRITSQSPSA